MQINGLGRRDHYYTKARQYDALLPAQKKDLAAKRLKHGHKSGAKDSKTKKDAGKPHGDAKIIKNLKAVNRTVAQLSKQLTVAQLSKQLGKTELNTDEASTTSVSSEETHPRAVKFAAGTNRANSVLTRQSTKDKKSSN
jgi:ABC-type Na+ efflux pump permease subunit